MSLVPTTPFEAFALTWAAAMSRACWQGALVIALVWLVCRALPRVPVSIRCWLWRLAYLKLIVALIWTSPVHLALLPAPPVRPVVREQVAPSAPAVAAPSPPAKPAPAGTVPRPRPPYGACALLVLWLIGVGWRVMDIAYEWRDIRRLRRGCKTVGGESDLRDLCERFGLHRAPRLLVNDDLEGPLLTGLLRPAIILPASLIAHELHSCAPSRSELYSHDSSATANDLAPMSTTHGRTELRLIIAHELAHLKRRDLLWNWLPAIAQMLFFFHPLVRLATREWKLAHESACDELTLLTTQASVADYGSVLLKVATNNRSPRYSQLVAVGVVESHQSLKRRFVMMEHAGQVTKRRLLSTGSLVLLLGVMAIVPWRVIAQSAGFWTTKAPIPVPGQTQGAAGVHGILYVMGGRPGGCNDSSSLLAYNPATNTWMPKSPMLTARSQFGVGVVNGVLYAIGGGIGCGSPSAAVEAYDPATNSWTTKAPMPTAREAGAVGVVNGVIYAVGGYNEGGRLVAAVEAYDPVTNTWTTPTSLPTPRAFLAVGVVDGILYAVGGTEGTQTLATVEAYNPALNTWATKAPMPTPRVGLAAGVIDGILYAVGGALNGGNLSTNEGYDPVTNLWTTEASMPTERSWFTIGVVNRVLYAVGGGNAASGPLVAANEAFTPTVQPPPSPGDLINSLRNEVKGLSGITLRQTNELVEKLDEASRQLARGHKKQAVEALRDFIEQVKELVRKKNLTTAQGSHLTGEANDIIKLIGPTKDKDDDKDKDDKKDDREKKEGKVKKK